MRYLLTATVAAVAIGGVAEAGVIERACLGSERPKSRALCGCIQSAADVTLNGRDQRTAARFFADPHQAQVVRQSDRASDEVFWQRYKQFGATATAYCRSG